MFIQSNKNKETMKGNLSERGLPQKRMSSPVETNSEKEKREHRLGFCL